VTEANRILTTPQLKALTFLATQKFATPADIGQAMGGTQWGSAQGLGRTGGAMACRLVKFGLVVNASHLRSGFPAYAITQAGRNCLAKIDAELGRRQNRPNQDVTMVTQQ
jgi:hypothetical protein